MCLITTALTVTAIPRTAYASTSQESWKVDYTVGAPQTEYHNPIAFASLPYTANGYYAVCSSISGTNDRKVTVNELDLGGFTGSNPKEITNTGRSNVWHTRASSTKIWARFKFVAVSSVTYSANGVIYQNN